MEWCADKQYSDDDWDGSCEWWLHTIIGEYVSRDGYDDNEANN